MFHDQGHHPHIHAVCCGAGSRSGYLTREEIARIESDLAGRIFHQELRELYERQTQRRDELTQEAGMVMAEPVQRIWEGTLDNPRIEQLMEHLAGKLKNLSDKKQYGYLRAPLKVMVDRIVDELARDERAARAYRLWYELREEMLRAYREDSPPRLLLFRQKKFKRIQNMVIEEVLRLGYESTVFDSTVSKEAPLERDTPEIGGEAPKKPEQFVDMEHIGPEGTRNHRGRSSNPYARYRLAKIMLVDPTAEPEQFGTTLEWLTETTDAGQVRTQCELEKIYRDDRSVKKGALLAAAWPTRVTKQDNDAASCALGVLLLAGGGGLARDVPSALNWLRCSAKDENQYAQYRLSRLLLHGEDVPREVEGAIRWLTASVEQGNRYAQYTLDELFLIRKEVSQDPETAVR